MKLQLCNSKVLILNYYLSLIKYDFLETFLDSLLYVLWGSFVTYHCK